MMNPFDEWNDPVDSATVTGPCGGRTEFRNSALDGKAEPQSWKGLIPHSDDVIPAFRFSWWRSIDDVSLCLHAFTNQVRQAKCPR